MDEDDPSILKLKERREEAMRRSRKLQETGDPFFGGVFLQEAESLAFHFLFFGFQKKPILGKRKNDSNYYGLKFWKD